MRKESNAVQYNHPPEYDRYIARNLWSITHLDEEITIDYKEYLTELLDTLCHHSNLWSLPMLDEEFFPVRGGPTCIPCCQPLDNGLFMIENLTEKTILCPINGTHTSCWKYRKS
jgi:hypothetical protein